jgi:class 3 adenylate cyclase
MRAAHLTGESKIVTILFADVVGSTALTRRVGAEAWTAIMNAAFERLSPTIERHGGTLARLMGDGLLAFFGAPVAHEDDAVRAASAALDLLQVAREYALEVPIKSRSISRKGP